MRPHPWQTKNRGDLIPPRLIYTGRYVFSHGATWNHVPLAVSERTLGDYMRAAGLRTAVCGKIHAVADFEGITRLGLDPFTDIGRLCAGAGFEPYARDDGIVPDKSLDGCELPYNAFLRAHGYAGRNPWHDYANSGVNADGGIASGWHMRNAGLAARVAEAHSERERVVLRAMRARSAPHLRSVDRGGQCDALVESIDLMPTFLGLLDQPIPHHVLEGQSLRGVLRGGPPPHRDAVFCELDYAFYYARHALRFGPNEARALMERTRHAKLVHYDGFPPQLYNLIDEPLELQDRGTDAGPATVRKAMYELLVSWMRQRGNRTTLPDARVLGRGERASGSGNLIGQW